MTRHPIPAENKRLAFEINTESGRILLAMSGDTATIAAIERGLAAASRLRRLAATAETALRRQLAAARQAEREAMRKGPEVIDDRIAQMRREAGRFDLEIPGVMG